MAMGCDDCDRRNAKLAGCNHDQLAGIVWALGLSWAAEALAVPEEAITEFIGYEELLRVSQGQLV